MGVQLLGSAATAIALSAVILARRRWALSRAAVPRKLDLVAGRCRALEREVLV